MTRSIAIFGVNGRTGRALLAAAAHRGWQVHGLVRPHSEAPTESANVHLVRGTFANLDAPIATLADADAACCVIGPRPPYTDVFCAAATATIVASMRLAGCRRLLCQTGAMVGPAVGNRSIPMEWTAWLFRRQRPEIARDREAQEHLVHDSKLEWTIVKPPRLTDAPARRRVRASPTLRVGLLSTISRADLAEFMLSEIEDPRFIRQHVFVTG